MKELHYDAFISYRHSEVDSFVAKSIQRRLENFKLPQSVLKKVTGGKTRIERVFLDVDELPLSDNLSDPISTALKNTDFLITICTPRYPQSRWCMKEIEVFLQTHPRDHILVVLAEDEPVNSFPEILTYEEVEVRDENGNTVITRRELEPLAADARGADRKEMSKAIDTAIIKLAAAIFGLNYDDLKQRHREQRIRRLATIFGGIGAAVLAFAIFATVMLIKISSQNKTISSQYNELQENFASSMASASTRLLEEGRRKDAVYAVRSVLSERKDGAYNPAAIRALYQALGIYKVSADYYPVQSYAADAWIVQSAVSFDGGYVLLDDLSTVHVYDADNGEEVLRISTDNWDRNAAFIASEGVILSDSEGTVFYPIGGGEQTEVDIPAEAEFVSSEDGSLTVGYAAGVLYGIGNGCEVIFETDLHDRIGDSDHFLNYAYLGDGRIICCFSNFGDYTILTLDAESGEVLSSLSGEEARSIPVVRLDGDLMYEEITDENADGNAVSKVLSIDTVTGETVWSIELGEIWSGSMVFSDERLYVYGMNDVVVMEKESGKILNRFSLSGTSIVSGWADGYVFMCITEDGSIYYCEDNYSGESTETAYAVVPNISVSKAVYLNEELFLVDAERACAVRFTRDKSTYATYAGEDYEDGYNADMDATDILTEREEFGANPLLLDGAFYSADEKFIFALFTDHTARIYDAKTAETVYSFETNDKMFDEFRYSDVTGNYILNGGNAYIFDQRMELICKADRIAADDGDGFIMGDLTTGYYRVPYVDPTELLKLADEYLGDYRPREAIRKKYGLP